MPTILLLQSTLSLTTGTAISIIQPQSDYLDLTSFQDIWIYTYLGSVPAAGAGTLQIQTAPIAEDGCFNTAGNALVTYTSGTATVGWQSVVGAHMGASPTFSRFLRWATVAGTNPYTWTFRILISANPITMR